MHPLSLGTLYGSPLPQKFQLAHRLFAVCGDRFLALAPLQIHLASLEILQSEVHRCMTESGMPSFCKACAGSCATGGCCSHAMTDENDTVLLLLNLLAGSLVALQREQGEECLFLGDTGCSLRFKPYFCLNYLCSKLRKTIDPGMLLKLARASGLLLQEQYAAEQFLLCQLRGLPTVDGSRAPFRRSPDATGKSNIRISE